MKKEQSEKIAINAVEIEIGGNKIKLTLEQVAELKKILAKAFPEKEKEIVYIPGPDRIVYERPWRVPYWPSYPHWEVTCKSDFTSSGTLCLSTT